jgi:hypothetical protein
VIGVDEIDPDRRVFDARDATPRRRKFDIDELKDLRPSDLFEADGFHAVLKRSDYLAGNSTTLRVAAQCRRVQRVAMT